MNFPLTQEFAREFGREWIEAWNAHDLEKILGHYANDVEFTSPFGRRILGVESTTIHGIAALRDYFGRALKTFRNFISHQSSYMRAAAAW
jgi:ketosteroid isomerase-like protein